MMKKTSIFVAVMLMAAFVLGASGSQEAAELVSVRVAMTPFFDYQFFSVAKEFGWDKELGLDLQFSWLTQSGPSIQALANGSVDSCTPRRCSPYPTARWIR